MLIRRLFYKRPHQYLNKINNHSKLRIHNNYSEIDPRSNPDPNQHDWFNFITSCVNCSIIFSILWGFEQYKEKIKLIEDTNVKISEIVVAYKLLEKKCITKRSI